MTIGQISDLHFGEFVNAEAVGSAIDVLLGMKPDMVVATGDFVTRLHRGAEESVAGELSRLRAPMGAYAVLGNHDHWEGAELVAEAIQRAGLALLRNSHVPVESGAGGLYLAGIDDAWERRSDLKRAMNGMPEDACTILLAHEPDYADIACRDRRIAFQISGHSHGGQIRFPVVGALHLPHLARKYPEGLRKVGSMWLYTNRGIGVVFPPVRMNCRPEISLFQLTREA